MADLENKSQEELEKKAQEEVPESERVFVRERILDRLESRRRWVRRGIALFVSAVVFGTVSCLVFVWLRPYAEELFEEKETLQETAIHLPRDEEPTEPPATQPTEESEQLSKEESESETQTTENIKEVVESAVESYQWNITDYENLYRAIGEVATEVNKGVVTVTTRTPTTDLFDNPIETEGKVSGVIWNITSYEMLILTGYRTQEGESTVEVTFCNGTKAAASVKSADARTGIAIVSVPLASVDEGTRKQIRQVPLGNSIEAKPGQPVILAGSPKDFVGSIAYGMITYVRPGVQKEDMDVRMIYTDVSTSNQATGFVLNLKGQIIGMVTTGMTGLSTGAVGISDLKSSIERLSNGSVLAYMGIVGQDVTEEISESKQIPRGVYVSDAVLEGPAYNAGLQSGDVVVALDDTEVLTVNMIETFLEGKLPEETVTAHVKRMGRDGYADMEFYVVLGGR
ncbi:MAG: serine protease [Lachnospiraceae bacterium]|nr:serine protease [Lachnospiraceae bacterium]